MSMSSCARPGQQVRPRPRNGDPVACERCAGRLELLTTLPRRSDHSAFRIFRCTLCNFVQWIPA
jgi:hypothetical protein